MRFGDGRIEFLPGTTQESYQRQCRKCFDDKEYGVFRTDRKGRCTYGMLPARSFSVPFCHSPALPGDADFDGDVDLSDFVALEMCLGGPGQALLPTGCNAIPTVSQWGLLFLAPRVLTGGTIICYRRGRLAG